jgi:hypothetical protein
MSLESRAALGAAPRSRIYPPPSQFLRQSTAKLRIVIIDHALPCRSQSPR